MSPKALKILYYTATGLLTVMMVMSAGMYFFNNPYVAETFTRVGYPTYLIYPLAIAKLLGLVAIWTRKSKRLKEWAYAGFFFNFLIGFFAHHMVSDGESLGALIALVLLAISYYGDRKVFKKK